MAFGGVGSWVAEALARSGVGAIMLIDLDDVCITSTNRQLPAMDKNFGKLKVEIMKERILAINPQCDVRALAEFFTAQTADTLLTLRLLSTPTILGFVDFQFFSLTSQY